MSEPSDAGQVIAEAEPARPGHPVLDVLAEPYGYERQYGQHVIRLEVGQLHGFAVEAKSVGFESCMELTVVDYFRRRPVRFELVLVFLSRKHNLRFRVLVPLDNDQPRAPSLTDVYPGVGFFEREAYDMFGISFDGNPDLTRILMPDDWEGHPLRKDYPVGAVPVQFRDAPKAT